eukprot:TRINITY_DN66658_c1_g18_i1.p2 TRINITY_DN66658_c1_g18~~TRINITY_DN66658_c1_g18_i1.p2  ORF type:complete len:100 (+),score=13.57 TRINITY_DN66658_c1_g18_i1:594-893(+)
MVMRKNTSVVGKLVGSKTTTPMSIGLCSPLGCTGDLSCTVQEVVGDTVEGKGDLAELQGTIEGKIQVLHAFVAGKNVGKATVPVQYTELAALFQYSNFK